MFRFLLGRLKMDAWIRFKTLFWTEIDAKKRLSLLKHNPTRMLFHHRTPQVVFFVLSVRIKCLFGGGFAKF